MKALACAALLTTSLSSCVLTVDDDSDFVIDNQSNYALFEVYLTEVDNPDWGPNLLGGDILYPGEFLEVRYLPCDYYDALVIDEFGADCELYSVDICGAGETVWYIDDFTLSTCDIFGATSE